MCHQTNLRFYDDIAYDKQYKGLILDGYEGDFLLHLLLRMYVPSAPLCIASSCDFSWNSLHLKHAQVVSVQHCRAVT